jgi:uncharacterized protein
MENAPPSTPAATPAIRPGDERNWCMWCHLSALAGYAIPFGGILGPLIVWQMKRDQFAAVDEHGKEALNFQLSVLIYLVGGGILAVVGMLFCVGWLILPALVVIPVIALIFTIIAGVKANDGVLYRYPMTLRLVK